MTRKIWHPMTVGGYETRELIQPSDESLEAGRDGDTIECITAHKSLLRVLVVDDCRDAADSLSILVTIWGHEVRVAYDAAAAFQMASAYQPDVLLLDVAMPKTDGCQLAQQLRRYARFKDALMIAITGYGDEAHCRLCEAAGFDQCLIKPVEPSTLEKLLLERVRLARPPDGTGNDNRGPLTPAGWYGAGHPDAAPTGRHCQHGKAELSLVSP